MTGPSAYKTAFETKDTSATVETLVYGRVVHGKKLDQQRALSDEPDRRMTFVMNSGGLKSLIGLSGLEILHTIGYSNAEVRHKLKKQKRQFGLVVFSLSDSLSLATWDVTLAMAAERYPEVAEKIRARADELKTTPLEKIEEQCGFSMSAVRSLGPDQSEHFMTLARFKQSAGSLADVRAFLFHVINFNDLFTGDGKTLNPDGKPGVSEYAMVNTDLADLADHVVIPLTIELPEEEAVA